MAIYTIDYTSTTTMLESIRAALDSAGILTTTHRQTATNLIVTTSRSTRVIRFNIPANNRFYVYYGTSYASGDTINDSVTLQSANTGTGVSSALIVTDDIWGLFEHRGVAVTCGFICSKLKDLAETQILWAWCNGNSTPLLHDADARAQMESAFYTNQIISTGDKYYTSEIPCMTAGNVFMSQGVEGIQAIHKTANYSSAYEINVDNVIVPGGGCHGNSTYMQNMSLYIPNGNSWTPPSP
jgi:hypothetical protein